MKHCEKCSYETTENGEIVLVISGCGFCGCHIPESKLVEKST